MLIKEDNNLFYLDNFELLSMQESNNIHSSVAMIPLFENNNNYIINLENLINYSIKNDITLDESLDLICNHHSISRDAIDFIINEEYLILNENLNFLIKSLKSDYNVFLEQSQEVKDFINNIDHNILLEYTPPDTSGFDYRHSGSVGDRGDTVATISSQISDSISQVFKDIQNMQNTEKNNINAKELAHNTADSLQYEIGRAAMNRHFLKGKGDVTYSGDYVGPAGQSYGYNSTDIKVLKNMGKLIDQRNAAIDRGEMEGKKLGSTGKMIAKGASNIMVKGLESTINSAEDRFESIAKKLKNEQVPRNFLARLIAKLRGIYNKVMLKLRVGSYQLKDDHEYLNYSNKFSDNQKKTFGDKIKYIGKTAWHVIKMALRKLADKLLWLIDTCLQKLQNMSNTAGDKIKDWLGKNKYDSESSNSESKKATQESFIFESNPIDWAKDKYKEITAPYDKKRYDKWTKENKESKWNKLNNKYFKVQDKHGETPIGGGLKSGLLWSLPMIPFGPAWTFGSMAVNGGIGAAKTAYNRYALKNEYGKVWKEEK